MAEHGTRCALGWIVLGIGMASVGSCQVEAQRPAASNVQAEQPALSPRAATLATMRLTSPAFAEGAPIPKKYTGEGEDVSPPLEWSAVPEGTQQLALICDDPDAPRKEPWVHWVLYKIPPDTKGLPEALPRTARLEHPPGAVQGKNSWPDGENLGYRGPMPPKGHGPHRYFFTLYALDQLLEAEPGLTKEELIRKMSGHVLGVGRCMGTYERNN